MILILAFIIILLSLYILSKKPDNFPPGPTRWPLLGNILMFKRSKIRPLFLVQKLKEKYGNVYGFFLGSNPVVVISGLEELKEAMAKPEFQGRPMDAVREMENRRIGIIMNDGPAWRENRRFVLRRFRDMGMGKNEMEEKIHEEIRYLISEAKRMAGEDWTNPVDVHELIIASGVNIILQLLAGYRFDRDDREMKRLLDSIRKLSSVVNSTGGIASNFPFLLNYAQQLTEYPVTKVIKNEVRNHISEMLEDHKKNFSKSDATDLINFYLREINTSEYLTENELNGVLEDLFFAGSDTTTGALAFSLLFMVLKPEIQAKIQNELDEVIGRSSLTSMSDKQRLPYLEATIQEVLRVSHVVPLSVPHSVITTEKSTNFRGYTIPTRSRIIFNFYDVNMDESIWGDPKNFRPERFIDASGNFVKDDRLMIFGSGKRVCVGESLARMNLFLTLATIVHKFTLSLPEGAPKPSTVPQGSFSSTTVPFSIIMKPR